MKKYGFFIGFFLIAFGSWAQQGITYEEVTVKAPTYSGEFYYSYDGYDSPSAINNYLHANLLRQEEFTGVNFNEGTVIVDFTVFKDGTVDNFKIQNSVSVVNDNAVIRALKATNGDWTPGEKDGTPLEMTKRLVIGFSDVETPSLEEQAKYYYKRGIKKLFDAEDLDNDFLLSADQMTKKKERRIKHAINHFNYATRLQPNEKSVIFMKMRAYKALGDMEMKEKLFIKLQEIANVYNSSDTDFVAILF